MAERRRVRWWAIAFMAMLLAASCASEVTVPDTGRRPAEAAPDGDSGRQGPEPDRDRVPAEDDNTPSLDDTERGRDREDEPEPDVIVDERDCLGSDDAEFMDGKLVIHSEESGRIEPLFVAMPDDWCLVRAPLEIGLMVDPGFEGPLTDRHGLGIPPTVEILAMDNEYGFFDLPTLAELSDDHGEEWSDWSPLEVPNGEALYRIQVGNFDDWTESMVIIGQWAVSIQGFGAQPEDVHAFVQGLSVGSP